MAFCLCGLFSETMVGFPIFVSKTASEVDSEQPSPGTPRKPWFLRDPYDIDPIPFLPISYIFIYRFWTSVFFPEIVFWPKIKSQGLGGHKPRHRNLWYIYRNIWLFLRVKYGKCYGKYTIDMSIWEKKSH